MNDVTPERLRQMVEDLLEVAGDYIATEPYLAHKYNYPGLVARIQADLNGTEPVLTCDPNCVDCVRKPQDLSAAIPEQVARRHRMESTFDFVDDVLHASVTCRACAFTATGEFWRAFEAFTEHVRAAAKGLSCAST